MKDSAPNLFDQDALRCSYQATEHRVIDQLQAATATEAPLEALALVEANGLWKEIAGVGFLRFLSDRGIYQEVISAYDTHRGLRQRRANPKRREQMRQLEAMAVKALQPGRPEPLR